MDAKNNNILEVLQQGEPVNLSDYMRFCLLDEKRGYYQNVEALGRAGDFITSPDISQIFGEVIGFWLLDLWKRCGSPKDFTLVELGGGHGTLMRDILSLVKGHEMFQALKIKMLEVNPYFQKSQKKLLHEFIGKITWHESLDEIPVRDAAVAVIGNEFLDTLPINQYQLKDGQWHMRQVIKDGAQLKFILGEPHDLPYPHLASAGEGDIAEVAEDLPQVMEKISAVAKNGGVLLVDYGYESSAVGESLQAIKEQKYADVLLSWEDLQAGKMPDLSAHVDFQRTIELANSHGFFHALLMSQRDFLGSMGGAVRLQILLQKANAEKQAELTKAYVRISQEMGDLFKVLMLYGDAAAHGQ